MKVHVRNNEIKDPRTYASYILANYCMPTLLGVKPSNLVSLRKRQIKNRVRLFHRIDDEMKQFNCNYVVLSENPTRILVLIYNKEILQQELARTESRQFLSQFGYEPNADFLKDTLIRLVQRFQEYREASKEFPHEIGLLLGYPLKDVEGFIKNRGKNYVKCGLWKVYGDEEKAAKTFEAYGRIREEAMKTISLGRELVEIKQNLIDLPSQGREQS